MSSDAAEAGDVNLPEWDQLELAVRQLLDDHDALLQRVAAAENRARELEAALRNVSAGELDPVALEERAHALEAENQDLLDRLNRARESVQRILGRLRFVEEES